MMCKIAKTNCSGAALRRAALAGGLALSVLLTALTGAQAQTTPNPNQTTQPTPYSWPGFHAGGTALYPFYDAAAPATGTSPNNPGTPYQALSPLYSQLMGTPSGFLLLNADGTLNPGVSVISEVSSFLLGNYNPLQPPTELTTDAANSVLTYFPNHFRDDAYYGGLKTWSAPFTYLTPPSTGLPIADDNSDSNAGDFYPVVAGSIIGTTTANSGWKVAFAATGGFGAAFDPTASDNPIVPTGNPGYVRASANATATQTAQWTFTAPAATVNPTVAGLYTVSLHLPDPAASDSANYPESRISDAHYVIKNTSTGVTLFNGNISQTETNDPQYLAGPFPLAAGNVITVTLDNSTATDLSNTANTYYVLADTVSLTPGSIAGGADAVNGSPTAINSTQYPEIQNALYFGETLDITTGDANFGQRTADNTNPYGNATIGTANTDPTHSIYQLVYFGRYETIVLTDAAGNLVDANGNTKTAANAQITTPVTEQVGAIYCVNGITGDIVWRFQTPDVLTRTGTAATPIYTRSSASQAVFTTPSVARVNVLVPQGTTPETYKAATKLVVIVGDDNGQVYCLDAIGNRNGVSNTTVLGATTSGAATYDQPIYAPNAPLNTTTTIDVTTPHVGTTQAYWVYRPDQTKDVASKAIRAYDGTRDLPQPQAFGTASPTVYTDPTVGIDTATLAPGVLSSADALVSNARVFIGNSNGTMYALDAGGVTVAATGTTSYLDSTDPYDTSRYVGINSFPIVTGTASAPYMLTSDNSPVPTAVPEWWFAVNGAQTNNTDATATVGITSAPALRLTAAPATAPTAANTTFDTAPELYFTTGNDTTNQGRVWAVGLKAGPVSYKTAGGTATALTPGSAGYNNVARPDWVFPNAFTNTGIGKIRPSLGSITGSPVVFTNPDDKTTRVYVAANSDEDDVAPADEGRIWAIRAFTETANFTNTNSNSTNAPGNAVWCYPDYYDPNVFAPNNNETQPGKTLGGISYTTANPAPDPLGAFENATPAVGVVQFPTTITYGLSTGQANYVHTDSSANGDGNRTSNDVRGQNVPMLYVGGFSEAPDSSNFFSLDLDGSGDNERNISYFTTVTTPAPVGQTQGAPGYECSPLLIVNSSLVNATGSNSPNLATGPGNGGVVFITGTDNNLYELSASPVSDVGDGSMEPEFPVYDEIPGFGPLASPAAAAFSGTTLGGMPVVNGVTLVGGAQDWVYGGDGKLGIARGITPANLLGSGAVGINLGTGGTGNDALAPSQVPLQFPLHSYIFDGKTTGLNQGSGQTPNMGQADPLGGVLPSFEWGEPVYIRISNVIPPNDAVLTSTGTFTYTKGNAGLLMADSANGADKSTVYTNGGPITIQLSDATTPGTVASVGSTDTVTIPATILPDSPGLMTIPVGEGFLHETPSGSGAQDSEGDLLTDNVGAGSAWIGAATYAIGDGSSRQNTPGSRRRIVSATQVAQAYTLGTNGYTFAGSVTLQVTVDSSANQFTRFTIDPITGVHTPASLSRIAPVDQPTFGILNPLAVQAGGYPLPLGAGANAPGAIPVVPTQTATKTGILGPFGGTHPTPTVDDLQAYANGNRIPSSTAQVPANGVVGGVNGTNASRRGQTRVLVITSTGDINHGTTGDNADPVNLSAKPPTGNQNNNTTGYVNPSTPNAPYGPYTLNVADRSALGNTLNAAGQHIQNLSVQPEAVQWHDNSALSGSNVYGPGAVVNPLPWETQPTAGQAGTNTSVDYPDIGASRLSHILMPYPSYPGTLPATGGDITNQEGTLDPALGQSAVDRIVYADPLQVQIRMPTYQPANLQVYDQTNAEAQTTPDQLTAQSVAFPEGYVTNEMVYIDTGKKRHFVAGDAYRTIRIFTGVPVDMTTTMDTTTIDLGRLPQGFGLNTDSYPALGTFMPYPTGAQLGVNAQNPGYVQFFKPLHVSNRGNVNLLNVHLDQKIDAPNQLPYLPFLGDTLDSLASIPSYDTNFNLTGPRPVLPNGTTAGGGNGAFLLRSSLDDDIAAGYGRNPALTAAGAPYNAFTTFHKARVTDANPSTLSVPDVPNDNTAGYLGYLPLFTAAPPVATASGLTDTNNNAVSGQPYIALAVPQGTPVGTYHQSVRLFEGVDPTGYQNIGVNANGIYAPVLPPQYGHQVVNPALNNPAGTGTANPPPNDTYNGLYDTWILNANSVPMQPASSAAVIKATVTEGRLTNGASKGDLPQVDAQPSGNGNGTASSANFLPSAFRDPVSGNVSTYWTSSAPRTGTTASPYTLLGANLPFTSTSTTDPTLGYFSPANPSSNWWTQIDLTAAPTPSATVVNSGISVTPGNGLAYAFVQNVAGGGGTPTTNNLLCYQVTPKSGALVKSTGVLVTQNTSQSTFGARGVSTTGTTFPDAYPSSNQTISSDLYAFWYGGARGRSAISYASSATGGGAPATFGPTSVLPIPAGLVSVSDPTAVLSYAPDPADNTKSVPVIEVTYTGIAADGNADIYVSRYRPYFVRKADNVTLAKDANNNNIVALALLPSPVITEQLLATDGNLYYQARDVAWARNDTINVFVGGFSVLQDLTATANPDGSSPLKAGVKVTYDRQTSSLVYASVPNIVTTTGQTYPINAIYVDLARGRIRFSPQLPVSTSIIAYATFTPQARRITTDSRADTAPISFIDTAQKLNEADSAGASLGNVEADRYWFIWRKSGASGTSTTPTLFYKTQRLTVALHDANNQPINIQLDTNKKPAVTVSINGNTVYTEAGGGPADVDWSRGRIYFPVLIGNALNPTEGQKVTVQCDYIDVNGNKHAGGTFTDVVHWLDEPRYNQSVNPSLAASVPIGQTAGQTAVTAAATGDAAIPIDTIVNESNVTAFLDPRQPHKVWLFWNSTRNGTADLYYETISPLFSATTGN